MVKGLSEGIQRVNPPYPSWQLTNAGTTATCDLMLPYIYMYDQSWAIWTDFSREEVWLVSLKEDMMIWKLKDS